VTKERSNHKDYEVGGDVEKAQRLLAEGADRSAVYEAMYGSLEYLDPHKLGWDTMTEYFIDALGLVKRPSDPLAGLSPERRAGVEPTTGLSVFPLVDSLLRHPEWKELQGMLRNIAGERAASAFLAQVPIYRAKVKRLAGGWRSRGVL